MQPDTNLPQPSPQSTQPPNPTPPSTQPGLIAPVTASNPMLPDQPKRHLPKWLRVLLIVFGVLLGVVIIIVIIAFIIASLRFQTISYDNNAGSQFTIKFYKGAETVKISALNLTQTEADDKSNGVPAILTKRAAGYQLALLIIKSQAKDTSLYDSNVLCKEPAFTLNTPAKGQSNIVCHGQPLRDKQLLYFYQIKSGNERYLVTMSLLHDNKPVTVPGDEAALNNLPKEADLRRYNSDLQLILPTIKVIE